MATGLMNNQFVLPAAEWIRALGNLALQNVVDIAAVLLGFAIGRYA